MEYQAVKNPQKPKSGFWIWILFLFLLVTSGVLLYLTIDAQYKIDYSRGKFDAALNTIGEKNEELKSLKTQIETANSYIETLTAEKESLSSEINSLNAEINSLNSKISSSSSAKITRVDVLNNNCANTFIFVDGRLAAGTREGSRTYFYIPSGSYDIQSCREPHKANCGSIKTMDISSAVFNLTVARSSSCP